MNIDQAVFDLIMLLCFCH